MKPQKLKLLAFPLLMISTGFVCGLVLWKFGKPTKMVVKKASSKTVPVHAVVPPPAEVRAPVQAVVPPPVVVRAPVVSPQPSSPKLLPELASVVSSPSTPPVSVAPPDLKRQVVQKKRLVRKTTKIRKHAAWYKADQLRIDRVQTIVVDEISDELFEVDETSGFDSIEPLLLFADQGLNEKEFAPVFDTDPKVAMVSLDESVVSGGISKEFRLSIIEGVISKTDFEGLRTELRSLENEPLEALIAPDSKSGTQVETKFALNSQIALEDINPGEVFPSIESNGDRASKESTQDSTSEQKEVEPLHEPELVVGNAESSLQTPNAATNSSNLSIPAPKSGTNIVRNSATAEGLVVTSQSSRIASVVPPVAHPQPNQLKDTQPEETEETKESDSSKNRNNNYDRRGTNADSNTPEEVDDARNFYGKIYIDSPLRAWLKENKAHFELYLHRENSKDPQDTRFIDYEFGEDEFEFEAEGLRGKYRLVAAFYSGTGATPVGQIQYPIALSSGDYKKRIIFELKKKSLDQSMSSETAQNSRESNVLNLTVFKGAVGNFRQTTPVAGAYVQVVGFPEWGTYTCNAEGNVRIPKVLGRSEYILEVSANGYYPTRQVVPVAENSAYAAVYLISKEDVYSVTHYFTKHEQQSGKAVVMGRVFNAKTRSPQKDEEVSLSFRKGRPVYFNSLPDLNLKKTTDTGLFGFFNVEPSIRSLQRASGKHSSLINLLPEYGAYYEFGRGGQKSLKGRIFDPYQNVGVSAKIHIVGDENNEEVSTDDGYFKIPAIDLPPGILTVEIRTEAFPTTWHTVPWNTRDPERVKNLFMIEKDVVEESRKINRIGTDRGRGTVIGGAENAFFQKGRACVQVRLEDQSGQRVPSQMGPFPLGGAKEPSKGFCLTRSAPGYVFFNIPTGEYILKWVDSTGLPFRSRVVRVGMDRVSVVVN